MFGAAYLAFATAVAIRFGAIPFHLWAARVADAAPGVALPLLMAWGPAAFAAVALVWIDQSVAPLVLPFGTERTLIAAVGAASVVLGLVAALVQDDLEHVVGYTIVADAGLVVLGLAVLDPAIWEPVRTWILIFVVARSALAAWVVALHGGFESRRLPELAGWARRTPVLAVGLVGIAVATIGWPGLTAWEARAAIADLSLPSVLAIIVTIAPLAGLAIYGRILADRAPAGRVRRSGPAAASGRRGRRRWPHRPMVGRSPVERAFEKAGHALSGALDVLWTLPAAARRNRMGLASLAVVVLAVLSIIGVGRRAGRAGGGGRRAGDRRTRPGPADRAAAVARAEPSAVRGAPGAGAVGRRQLRAGRVRARGVGAGRIPAERPRRRVRTAARRRPPGSPAGRRVPSRPDRGGPARRPSVLRREHPAVDLAGVVEQLVRPEPERDLGGGGLGAVRRVDEVLRGLEREVAADRARRRLVRPGRPVHRPDACDRVRALEDGRDERRARDEVDEPAEERLLAMDRVVPLGQVARDLDQLQADELQAAVLVAGEDPAGEQALDAVGLDQDEGAFVHGRLLCR